MKNKLSAVIHIQPYIITIQYEQDTCNNSLLERKDQETNKETNKQKHLWFLLIRKFLEFSTPLTSCPGPVVEFLVPSLVLVFGGTCSCVVLCGSWFYFQSKTIIMDFQSSLSIVAVSEQAQGLDPWERGMGVHSFCSCFLIVQIWGPMFAVRIQTINISFEGRFVISWAI